MRILVSLLILCLSAPAYAQIKKVSIYPSGISISWTAVPPAFAESTPEQEEVKPKKKRGAVQKPAQVTENPASTPASDAVDVTRLVRVVSAMDLKANEHLALVFYDKDKKHLKKFNMIVSNTAKPSAANAFFMDKAVYSGFKGLLDTYFFPSDAVYMNLALVDKRGGILSVPAHPSYDADTLLSIEEFEALEKGKRMMLQFEIRGEMQKNVLRMSIFRFR